ncbi:hypothetical protein GTR02_02585 [Kineococcus sp. R8]|nr:hypothetical protein [Kineococcus siccus]
MTVDEVRERLAHVRWIGGGSGAGKSTVTRALAQRCDLRVLDTDAAMADHARRARPDRTPALQRFLAAGPDERWLGRTPAAMLEDFPWFRGEGFGLLVEDLLALPADRPVLVEGFRLLPDLVQPLLARPGRAVWLLPTPTFRRTAFEARGGLWTVAGRTSDPPRALANLLERDRLFTERLHERVRALGLAHVPVDGSRDLAGLVEDVAVRLGLT